MSPRIIWANGRRDPDVAVYISEHNSQCAGCGNGLKRHDMITRNGEGSYCLSCSELDGLEFLPAGSTSVTGLAMGYTGRKIIVYQGSEDFSKRVGILAPAEAIRRAQAKSQRIAEAKAAIHDWRQHSQAA